MTYEEIRRRARDLATDYERGRLAEVLADHDWSATRAAETLQVPARTLQRALHRVGLGDRLSVGRPKKSDTA